MQKDGMTIRFSGEERFVGTLDPEISVYEADQTVKRLDHQAGDYHRGGSELIANDDPAMAEHGRVLIGLSQRIAEIACELEVMTDRQPDTQAS